MEDIGDLCTHCGRNTARSENNGLFVNRVPNGTGEVIGYLCSECQAIPCDGCNQNILDFIRDDQGNPYCVDCYEKTT